MTRAESILASRLLDVAAESFSSHGCNDMSDELFEDLEPEELAELERGYNAWNLGDTGETCGVDDHTPLRHVGDAMWMAYLAAVIGRQSATIPTVAGRTGKQWQDRERELLAANVAMREEFRAAWRELSKFGVTGTE